MIIVRTVFFFDRNKILRIHKVISRSKNIWKHCSLIARLKQSFTFPQEMSYESG
jgi:hypothetical protein